MMTNSQIVEYVIGRLREIGQDIASERGWVLDPKDVARNPAGGINITWQLPNEWFHRQVVEPDMVWFSRVAIEDQLRHRLRQYDLGGPMPNRFLQGSSGPGG